MAAENYVRDLSILKSGRFTDLVVKFGEKSWPTHKAIISCHSKWFENALSGGFAEAESGTITLQDEADYADAINCMMSYFYEAKYDVSTYKTDGCLLHAQVAIIADKYICSSLLQLATRSFADTIKTVDADTWASIAADIYNSTSTESHAHVEIRDLVATAFARRQSAFKSALRNETVIELLRSSPDLATDLLLCGRHGPKAEEISESVIFCEHCKYVHVGSRTCPTIASVVRSCPKCGQGYSYITTSKELMIEDIFPCPSCDGMHTVAP